MSAQNLTLLTDLYELTMMQGYFETQENQTVVFDVFFRDNPNKGGYSVMAGLDQVIDYIKNLNFSYEDVDYLSGSGRTSSTPLILQSKKVRKHNLHSMISIKDFLRRNLLC